MPDLPVACTLGPEALTARRLGLLAQLRQRADSHDELADGHRLTLNATEETLTLMMKTVEAERKCCQFLRFQITVEPGGGPAFLDLTGPAGTREFLAALLKS
jgi:hypothetical protein